MGKFASLYYGHDRGARKAALQLGLVTEEDLAIMSDKEVHDLINNSGVLIFRDGDDYALIPKECEKKIVWIER